MEVTKGKELLFMDGKNIDTDIEKNNGIIVNFNNRYVFESFIVKNKKIIITTLEGEVELLFKFKLPPLQFSSFETDRLILRLESDIE